MIFPIVDATLEQIFHCNALYAIHSVSLTRSRLTIGKYRYYSLIENQIQNRSDLIKIKLFVRLMLAKGIIKFELCVFNCFGHTIHLVFAIVYEYLRICYRNDVYLSISEFVMEYRSLLKADTNFHLIGKCM